MTDTTNNFDPAPRLQQIAATIRERGAYTFDAPATAAYYIDCAIKEIERLRKEAFALSAWSCREIDRITDERDEARRMLCEEWAKQDGLPLDWQGRRGAEGMAEFVKWDCFKENTND